MGPCVAGICWLALSWSSAGLAAGTAKDRVALVMAGGGLCSGFVLDGSTVLTAGHCVEEGAVARVAVHPHTVRETRFDARAVWRVAGPEGDLAVLAVPGRLPWDRHPITALPRPGDLVRVLGFPTVGSTRKRAEPTIGEVVSLHADAHGDGQVVFRPTSGRLDRGSSGAPILARDGTLAGVVSGRVWRRDDPDDKLGRGWGLPPLLERVPPTVKSTRRIRIDSSPSLALLPGPCIVPGDRGFVLEVDCEVDPALHVEARNLSSSRTVLPLRFEVTVPGGEVLHAGVAPVAAGVGLYDSDVSLRPLGLPRDHPALTIEVAYGDLVASIGPITASASRGERSIEVKTARAASPHLARTLASVAGDLQTESITVIDQGAGTEPLRPGIQRRGFDACRDWLP